MIHKARMTTIHLPDQAPPVPRTPKKLVQRPTPCAGLFGWRKSGDDKPVDAPSRDHPVA